MLYPAMARADEKGHALMAYGEQATAKMQMAELERIAKDEGRTFVHPFEGPLTALGKGAALTPEFAAVMAKAGFKTLHMPDVDFRSSCVTFVACLKTIRAWSDAHLAAPKPTMFYMFSGPDFIYADAFYSKATTYVLSALEPPGAVMKSLSRVFAPILRMAFCDFRLR